MSSLLFLLQREQSRHALSNIAMISEDTASVFARIEEHNWLHYNNKYRCKTAYLDQLPSMSLRTLKNCIPIGNIEFVEEVLRLAHNIPSLSPIVLPEEILSNTEWMRRRYAFRDSIDETMQVFSEFGTERLFVKSASRLKADYTGIYCKTSKLPNTTDAVFLSECIDILSEWRIFVSRSKLVDIRNYDGDPWMLPDKDTVFAMISAIGDKYPAYTLDVGISTVPAKSNATVAIEVHNFISCGTYGAFLPLRMYVDAYRYELSKE